MAQLSHPYMTTIKTIALTRRIFFGNTKSLFLNMLSRLVIAFLLSVLLKSVYMSIPISPFNPSFLLLISVHLFSTSVSFFLLCICAVCLVAQLCPTVCDLITWGAGDSSGMNTGVGCHTLLEGIFPTQGSNPGLTHSRWFFTIWTNREACFTYIYIYVCVCVCVYVCVYTMYKIDN